MDPDKPAQIPNGRAQLIAGVVLMCLGLLGCMAATPFNGAGQFADSCVALAAAAFMWSALLRYISLIEKKIDALRAVNGNAP